jgi:hypothetical protein
MDNKNKLYEVIVPDRASDMLMQHMHFMAQVTLQAADKLRAKIIEAAKSLENFPERNSWLLDAVLLARKYRKMIISKRYLIIYQIKADTVYVEYVLDYRQDYQWLLR